MSMTDAEWLQLRKKGIGASEASAIIGRNPHMSNVDLWEIKTGRREAKDLTGNIYVDYGTSAEAPLRQLFALDFPQFTVRYKPHDMRYHPEYPFIFATLDGELTENDTGRQGVYEGKTAEIQNASQYQHWNDRIPENYYIQVVHQLMATGYDFAVLKAQLKTVRDGSIRLDTRHYFIERADVAADIDYLLPKEIAFWKCVEEDRRPNLILPPL